MWEQTHTAVCNIDCLFSVFFYEAVVQQVTYVTDFCRDSRVVYPSWVTTPRKFKFSGTGVVAALRRVR